MSTKNAAKITTGLKALTEKDYEIVSGTVVSVDADSGTMSVLITGYDDPIEGVMLNAVTENANGFLLIPEVNSHVIIGSVDGPGAYFLVRASNLQKAIVTIGSTSYTMDASGHKIKHGSDTLAQIMSDLLDALLQMTVTTGTGPSGTPINSTTFTAIKNRLTTLLI